MLLGKKLYLKEAKNDIVLIGEILADIITDVDTGHTYQVLGGSTSNISVNIQALGFHPLFCGSVGNDNIGEFIQTEISKYHVDTTYLTTVNHETTVVSINKASQSPIPHFNRSSDFLIPWNSQLEAAIENTKILHFSYWPLSQEPSKSTILKAIQVAKANHVIIGFDPNYHTDLDQSLGTDIELMKSIMKDIDVIKPSLDDSIRIFGEGFTNLEYMNKYRSLGCKLVIMTLGKDGLIASDQTDMVELPSMATKILDTTGAGDAFWGGLYSGILNEETILDAIKIGLKCSAYNLENIGSHCDFPSLNEIKKELNLR